MKEKILAALKAKYKSTFGLDDATFTKVSEVLEAFVTEESAIDAAVEKVAAMLKQVQSEADKRAKPFKEAAAKWTKHEEDSKEGGEDDDEDSEENPKPNPNSKGNPKPNPKKTGGKDEKPEYVKNLEATLEKLTTAFSAMQGKEIDNGRKQKFDTAIEKAPSILKKSLATAYGQMKFEKDEDHETFLTDLGTQIEEANKELGAKGLQSFAGAPGSGSSGSTEKPSDDALKSVLGTFK